MFDNIKDNDTVFVPAVLVWGVIVMATTLCVLWFYDSLYMDALLTGFAEGCYSLVMWVGDKV